MNNPSLNFSIEPIALRWTFEEVADIVAPYPYLRRYSLPALVAVLMHVYKGNVIEFLHWGWQELERFEELMRSDEYGNRQAITHTHIRVHASAQRVYARHIANTCSFGEHARLH